MSVRSLQWNSIRLCRWQSWGDGGCPQSLIPVSPQQNEDIASFLVCKYPHISSHIERLDLSHTCWMVGHLIGWSSVLDPPPLQSEWLSPWSIILPSALRRLLFKWNSQSWFFMTSDKLLFYFILWQKNSQRTLVMGPYYPIMSLYGFLNIIFCLSTEAYSLHMQHLQAV